MDNKNDGSKLLGRRRTLQLLGVGVVATGLFGLVAACKDKDGAAPTGDKGAGGSSGAEGATCDTVPDETSKGLRKTLQYKKVAAVPEKRCNACAQYVAGKFGECGGCKLFTGPVQPLGGCLSFAPIGSDAAPPG